ncbi:MAG TPA: hypothetical protein VMC08_09450 [Bacteroidales bacterium]|nr:hypothetical protein [Bacteroidales bacterium]
MNKTFLTLMVFLTSALPLFAQQGSLNETRYDTAAKQQILIGLCNREGLNGEIFGQYFKDEYDHYQEDPEIAGQIRRNIAGTEILIVMATWCGDSKEQVGRFYKILDNAGFPADKLTLVCVDKSKKGGPVSLEGKSLEKVPTFIVYRKGMEEGRIVESPTETLEKDLLRIIQK